MVVWSTEGLSCGFLVFPEILVQLKCFVVPRELFIIIPSVCDSYWARLKVTMQPSPPLLPNNHTHQMPRRSNKKAEQYANHEERVTEALKYLGDDPVTKLKHVATAHDISGNTLTNRYYGHTQATRDAHLERRKLW